MRITVSIPEKLGKSIKDVASNEGKSMSSLTAEALLYYFHERKKRALSYKLLKIAGKTKVSKDVYKLMEESRMNDDRS